jgi:hypothetical protein
MKLPITVNPTDIRIADIGGVTSNHFISCGIKAWLYGIKKTFSWECASHIATVYDDSEVGKFSGNLRLIEMDADGIESSNLSEYNPSASSRYVFVGRHSEFDDVCKQIAYNNLMIELKQIRLGYGFITFADYILENFGIRMHELPNRAICSVLPYIGYLHCSISDLPDAWKKEPPTPKSWQEYKSLKWLLQ